MQTESMEKSRQSFHQTQNADCQNCPKTENDPQNDSAIPEKTKKNSELRNLEFKISFFHNFYLINFILIWAKIFWTMQKLTFHCYFWPIEGWNIHSKIRKWYFVAKIVLTYCSSDLEKLLKFEAEGREFAKFLRSLEQFLQTVKCQNNFW